MIFDLKIKDNSDQNDAEFVLSYSIDAILQIKNRVGNMDKPFGKEHGF